MPTEVHLKTNNIYSNINYKPNHPPGIMMFKDYQLILKYKLSH